MLQPWKTRIAISNPTGQPFMIVDSHTHIFPERIRDRRVDFLQGEPGFSLLYADTLKSRLVGAEELIAVMDEQGVDRSVVFGFPWRSTATMRLHNTYVMEAVAAYPERLSGLCCLDPFVDNAVAEVERCIAGGLVGVGELAFYDRGLDSGVLDALEPVMRYCRVSDLPVMIHTNEPVGHRYPGKAPMTLEQITDLLQRFPDNRLILAHWGGGLLLFHLMKKGIKELLCNTWFDTAASPFLYDSRIYRVALDILGPDRILFGSDFPLLQPQRYFREMAEAGLTEEERAAISGLNAGQLFNLETA